MPSQTVFDVGDPITSRLNLGTDPDGTTAVTLAVYRPNGVALSPAPSISVWQNVREKTAQWFATDDGYAGSATTAGVSDGDWLAVWTVTGTGASVTPKVYPVRLLLATSTRPAWSPFLSGVADHVPYLTVDLTSPGDQTYLGTFTGSTAPTDEQAQRHIDRAVAIVGSRLGTVPASLYPLAAAAAEVAAAASLARAFPRTRSDIDTSAALDAAATVALAELRSAVDAADTAPSLTPQPVAYAPESPWYADLDL